MLLAWPATTILVARDSGPDGPIVGTATLVLVKSPAGTHARLEDLVVDESAREQGVGEALTREIIRLAGEGGARYLALTSNPRREAANRLYQRMGFKPWETNVYRYDLA